MRKGTRFRLAVMHEKWHEGKGGGAGLVTFRDDDERKRDNAWEPWAI